jgi:hypothetical protein
LLALSVTATSEDDATAMVTVPVELIPPMTVAGFNTTELSVGIDTEIGSVKLTPLSAAVMFALPAAVSVELAVTTKVAVVEFSGTTTVPGTVATETSDDLSATATPPVGAAPLRVTVPSDVPPTETAAGTTVRLVSVTVGVCAGRKILQAPLPYVPATR